VLIYGITVIAIDNLGELCEKIERVANVNASSLFMLLEMLGTACILCIGVSDLIQRSEENS